MIHEARTKLGLTRAELGAACGVSGSYIRDLESGARFATPRTLQMLAAVLRLDAVTLLVLQWQRQGQATVPIAALPDPNGAARAALLAWAVDTSAETR